MVRRWFARLPIHRKLVAVALVVTTTALIVATGGLALIDVYRYRVGADDDTTTMATVFAENLAAAVAFRDVETAQRSLEAVRVRPTVRRACLYLPGGTLFAGVGRTPDQRCPIEPVLADEWRVVRGAAPVTSNDRVIGQVVIDQDLADIETRVALAGLTGLAMLLVAGTVAFVLAHRLHRSVSAPITQLAKAASAIEPDAISVALPRLDAVDDEVGDLVRAFTDMLQRVRTANAQLLTSNEALRRQEAEREQLLTREREVSRLKDEFLAAVSHELRTPLNAIVGWTQILTSTPTDQETTGRAVASIARNARTQARLIEDLVDVSRIVTGKLSLRFEPVDVREVVEAAIDIARPTADAKAQRIETDLPDEPCLVDGDRERLQQIVANLASNAVKFTPTGGVISIALARRTHEIDVTVSDTGLGIPASFLPHVFDRFRQADGSMTREHGGLGLGLAIVKELTELHGGSVAARSAGRGQGATFAVRLPALAGSIAAPGRASARLESSTELAGVAVLAVDDNLDALELLASCLKAHGADVRVCASGQDLLREWARRPADVLVCDLAMPHMDGFDVLQAIRAREQANGRRAIPAIALTAHVSEPYQQRTRAAGFEYHLAKPYDVEELVRTVHAAAARRTPGSGARHGDG